MMSTAHSQPVLIRERGEIVRMRRVHDKPNEGTAFFLWTKHASSRQFREALDYIARKLRIVFENCRPPDPLNVINRSREADGSRDIWRSALEPMRRLLERALVESDAYYHFATTVPRWHRIQGPRSSVEHADSSRTTHLVSGKRQEIAAQFAHIEWQVPDALRSVHERECAHCARLFAKLGDWIDCAERI